MALRYYDEALVSKLKKWVKDSSLTITSPEETKRLFEYRADINKDNPIQLPLVAIRRDRSIEVQSTNKKPMSFNGLTVCKSEDKIIHLDAIPVGLSYQLDIYTRYFDECDEYLRNFIFNIINYPKLEVLIPYNNVNLKHVANIRMDRDVSDNSDIPERLAPGQFTRFTIKLTIDDAYLFSAPVSQSWKLDTLETKLQADFNNKIEIV